MSKSLVGLAAVASLLTCGAVVAIAAPGTGARNSGPNEPRIEDIGIDPSNLEVPRVTKPRPPRLDLQPAACTTAGCDPRQLAGTVTAFDGTTLTVRTDAGRTYRAVVNGDTNVACPPQAAIDDGRVFNPVPPTEPQIGSGGPALPADVELRDRYACSASEISAGRRIAGAAVGSDDHRQLRWIGVALAPR